MDITNLVVIQGLVAKSNTTTPQLFRVTATTADIHSGVSLTWQTIDNNADSPLNPPFATATLHYGSASAWLASWAPLAHLIHSRIESLSRLAADGTASRFSRNMAYTLFASNLVDYADKYRGMQTVVLHGLEGYADMQLTTSESGVWTVPPYFIDSVAHLAGFIMNCSDAVDARNNYCVTSGWDAMKFAKQLVPGAKYRSYVKMIPTAESPTIYFGDVYVMQDEAIMGMVNGIQFRRYPRILLSRLFSPPDKMAALEGKPNVQAAAKVSAPTPAAPKTAAPEPKPVLSSHDSGLGSKDEQSKPATPTTAPPKSSSS